ncbi:Hydroxymethylglutaryl-coenzyme A synthase, partial [Ancylostoma duodenale]
TLTASSFEDREVMKCLLKGSEELWKTKTCPYLELNRRIGNMYTPSLFAQLVAYIASGHSDELNRILFFAYGSGSAAAMFSATLNVSSSAYQRMMEISRRAIARLEERHVCAPEQYTDALKMREEFLASDVPITPKCNSVGYSMPTLFPGTYFLKMVDERYRRVYDRTPLSETAQNHLNGFVNGTPGVAAIQDRLDAHVVDAVAHILRVGLREMVHSRDLLHEGGHPVLRKVVAEVATVEKMLTEAEMQAQAADVLAATHPHPRMVEATTAPHHVEIAIAHRIL